MHLSLLQLLQLHLVLSDGSLQMEEEEEEDEEEEAIGGRCGWGRRRLRRKM